MINKRRLVGFVIGGITVLYPAIIYFSIQSVKPWNIAVILALLLLLRSITISADRKWNQWLVWVGLLYCMVAIWNNNLLTLRFYPVLMNLSFFIVFVSSLFFPPPIVERLARLQHPNLSKKGVAYTRKVTKVWCLFFIFNGGIATITALWSNFDYWSLYNGLISYLLIGLLMGIEYLVRIRTQKNDI